MVKLSHKQAIKQTIHREKKQQPIFTIKEGKLRNQEMVDTAKFILSYQVIKQPGNK